MEVPEKKYQTARSRQLRQNQPDEEETRTLDHIEERGVSILHVGDPGEERPFFSYTIGVFDTCGKPEIITKGLKEDLAGALLNEAVRRLRKGVDLSKDRHADLIGDVDCEFRAVAPKWVDHLMGWAKWYNGNADFPVLQAIYPDRENRFPGEEGFNEYFRQPLLQPDAPQTRKEEDFWAENDPSSSLSDWKFPDPPHASAYLSNTVHEGKEPVTYVCHDLEDGAWQFLGDSMSDGGGPVLSCLHHPLDKDPTLIELFDLPTGWYAERETPAHPWIRHQLDPEKSEDE